MIILQWGAQMKPVASGEFLLEKLKRFLMMIMCLMNPKIISKEDQKRCIQ